MTMPLRTRQYLSAILCAAFLFSAGLTTKAYDCQGSCQDYYANAQCPSGMEWDFSAYCSNSSESDNRCCNPTGSDSFPTDGDDDNDFGEGTTGGGTSSDYPYGGSTGSSSTGSNAWQQGISTAGKVAGVPSGEASSLLITFMQWLLGIFIILAFISFVVTGIMYLLAGADKNMAEKAKAGFQYSIIALVVTLSAFIIIMLIDNIMWGTPA